MSNYVRKTRDVWNIWAQFAGCPPEVVDGFDTRKEARAMADEYRLAYGPGVPVWYQKGRERLPDDAYQARTRLEAIRRAIDAGRASYCDIVDLQSLVPYIDPSDVQLLEWAGVPEFPEDADHA